MKFWDKVKYLAKGALYGAANNQEGIEGLRAEISQKMSLEEAIKSGRAELMNVPNRWVPITEEPKDPEPDLSTKPEDIVGYCFGFVCPKKHINSAFESITIDGYRERRVCQICGAVTKPATVKRIAEARWKILPFLIPKEWGWSFGDYDLNTAWTKYEFVQFLDSPKTRKTARKK